MRYLPEPKAECVDMLSTYLSSNRPRYRDLPASECGHMAQAEAKSLWLTLISCPFVPEARLLAVQTKCELAYKPRIFVPD